METVAGQPSWRLATSRVELYVTRTGGHVGPATFDLGGRRVLPFSVNPWSEERIGPPIPSMLNVLRGDFFCLPFGGNETPWRGEKHPAHGDTAELDWTLDEQVSGGEEHTLRLSMQTRSRPGRVEKLVRLVEGQPVIYQRHTISGMSGPMPLGHHLMLKFPPPDGSGRITTSPFEYGQVFPTGFEKPVEGGYNSLRAGATFEALSLVPMLDGELADVSRYPAREGFEDLLQYYHPRTAQPAWTAVAFPEDGYAWFSLKDPRVLPGTVLWISNGGRHYAPWNGRHRRVMGIEDVVSYFHYGLAESAEENLATQRGVPTAIQLDPNKPTVVNYIMAVVAIPRTFERVASMEVRGDGVTLVSPDRGRVDVPVETAFLAGA